MKNLINQENKTEILRRLQQLRPDSERRWGRMSPHQAVCHLSDAFRVTMGAKEAGERPVPKLLSRTVVKWIALKAPLKWPQGVKTRPAVDQEVGGTKPVEFARDVQELEALIERFTRAQKDFQPPTHPIFGQMSEQDWQRWAYLHMDHHLRQFGL